MESAIHYVAGLTITTVSAFIALWVNDTFAFGGELPEETAETIGSANHH